MYTHGWFILRFDRKQNSVPAITVQLKNKFFKKNLEALSVEWF